MSRIRFCNSQLTNLNHPQCEKQGRNMNPDGFFKEPFMNTTWFYKEP